MTTPPSNYTSGSGYVAHARAQWSIQRYMRICVQLVHQAQQATEVVPREMMSRSTPQAQNVSVQHRLLRSCQVPGVRAHRSQLITLTSHHDWSSAKPIKLDHPMDSEKWYVYSLCTAHALAQLWTQTCSAQRLVGCCAYLPKAVPP
jgi:hypothetical protein